MILNPVLFYIKVVQMMVKKKKQHKKTWGGGGGDKLPWTGCPPPRYNFFFYFSDIENKFIGLVL